MKRSEPMKTPMKREPYRVERQLIDRSAPRAREHATPLTEKASVRKVHFPDRRASSMAPKQGAHKRGRDEVAPHNRRLGSLLRSTSFANDDVQRQQRELQKIYKKCYISESLYSFYLYTVPKVANAESGGGGPNSSSKLIDIDTRSQRSTHSQHPQSRPGRRNEGHGRRAWPGAALRECQRATAAMSPRAEVKLVTGAQLSEAGS